MVNAVYAMGKYFHIQGKKNNYEALTVILATGVDVTKPYAGEYENLGRGVSYCATCDAALYKEREAIVIGFNEEALSEAEFLALRCAVKKWLCSFVRRSSHKRR